jgi:simple sugar transport system permease protein
MTDLLLAAAVRATPLLVVGLAVAIAFRAGMWNIGAEGQFYAGAVAATWIGTTWGLASGMAALAIVPVAAAMAGVLWAAVPALLRVRFGVLEVITTIMLNFIGEHLVSWLVHGPLQETGRTYPVSQAVRLGALVPGTRLTWALPLAMVTAGVAWLVLTRTRPGLTLRAVGANPLAASIAGRIRVGRVSLVTFLLSGALAGLAGAAEVCGVTFALYERLSPGYGYTAIAVALLARLHPLWLVASAGFFGFLEAGAAALQRSVGLPSVTVYALEALIVLAVVVLDRRWRHADV